MELQLSIGDTVRPDFCLPSTAVGVDRYLMRSFDGREVRWDSYTLASDSPAPYDRWWLVNTPGRGAHVFTAADEVPADAGFRKELSGLVALNSEGDAALSGDVGALAMYADASDVLYAEEVFGDADRLVFVGRPFAAADRKTEH
ncbi:hypothetical protein [Streptomyces sp. NPDC093089]|uniref:hypothetical protein n=1 Tax=Streptomyces sp. NPDC093089 TaxID=3366024 RepID=UPI00381BECD0